MNVPTKAPRHKYRFPTRLAAEEKVRELERTETLHGITLYCLIRDEFTWTEKFTTSKGSWFQIGLAHCNRGNGGVMLNREGTPSGKPTQHADWAEAFFQRMTGAYQPSDEEGIAYRNCLMAARELYNRLAQS